MMSNLTWPRAFPGGVTDQLARHALIRDTGGRCTLLRLADGALLWRSAESARPLLLDDGLAIGLLMAPPRVMAWSLQGDERWRSPALPWPAWAATRADLNPASDLHAGWMDGDIVISWQLRVPRPGGAGRGPGQLPATPAAGAVRLQRDTGTLSEAPALEPRPDAAAHAEGSDDPRVLAQSVFAGIRYAMVLHEEGGRSRIALTAHDSKPPGTAGLDQDKPGAGDARWTCWLDGFEPRRPPPHRP